VGFDPKILNTIGLILGILGVLIIFIWGPPQPEHSKGVSLGLEDATPIDKSGKTVVELNIEVKNRKKFFSRMSSLGLALIMVGFAFQLLATWMPGTKKKSFQSKIVNQNGAVTAIPGKIKIKSNISFK